MWKKITLRKDEVATIKGVLALHQALLATEAPGEWPLDHANLDKLLNGTLKELADGPYLFRMDEIELINRALRSLVRQLFLDLQLALEEGAPQAIIYSLYDSQQDAFILLGRFAYYTTDRS